MRGHNCENSKCTAANEEIGKIYSYGNHLVCSTCYVPAYDLSELNLSEMWNREWPAKWMGYWQVKIDSSLRKPAAVFRSNFDFFLSGLSSNQTQNMSSGKKLSRSKCISGIWAILFLHRRRERGSSVCIKSQK